MGIVGVRLLRELNGISALPLELTPQPKKATCVSRSFLQPATTLAEVRQSIARHVTRLTEKLRQQQQNASSLTIFIHTSQFQDDFYSNSIALSLPFASNQTPVLLALALQGLTKIYRDRYSYKKAGAIA